MAEQTRAVLEKICLSIDDFYEPAILYSSRQNDSPIRLNTSAAALLGYPPDQTPSLKNIRPEEIHTLNTNGTAPLNLGFHLHKKADGSEVLLGVRRKVIQTETEIFYLEWLTESPRTVDHTAPYFSFQQAVMGASIVSRADLRGTITDVNENFVKISGYSRAELIGQNHRIINSGHHPRSFWMEMWSKISAGKIWRGEVKNKAKDGSFYWVDTFVMPFKDEQGKITEFVSVRNDITLRKQQEEQIVQLNQSLHDFQQAIHTSSIVSRTDKFGTISFVNQNFVKISGYSAEELKGKNHRIINSGYHPKSFWKNMWETISAGKMWRGEVKNKAKNGSFYWVDTFIMPFLDETGKVKEFLSVRNDITSRKQQEQKINKLNQSLSEFQQAIDKSSIVSMADKRGDITYVNENFVKISGYSAEELIGENHRIINSGHHPKSFWVEMWRTISSGKVWRAEVKNKAKDGSFYWVDTFVMPFLDEKGDVREFLSIRNDITLRKHSEEQLAQSNSKMAELFVFGKMGSLDVDCLTSRVIISPELLSLLGEQELGPLEVMLDDFLYLYLAEGESESFKRHCSPLKAAQQELIEFQCEMNTATGDTIALEVKGAYKDNMLSCILLDITDRRRKENEILQSTKTIQGILESITDGFFLTDKDLNFVLVNPVFGALAQKHPDEMVGRNILELFPYMENSKLYSCYKTAIRSQKSFSLEIGNPFTPSQVFLVNGYPTRDGLFVYYQDISSLKLAEESLFEKSQLLNRLSENVPGMIYNFYLSEGGRPVFPFVSSGSLGLTGLPPESLMEDGKRIFEVIHNDDVDRVETSIVEAFSANQPWSKEFRIVTAQGEVKWIAAASNPYIEKNGENYWYGFMYDITPQKQALHKVEESELKSRLIVENSGEGIIFSKADGAIISANPEACRIFSLSKHDIETQTFESLIGNSDVLVNFVNTRNRFGYSKGEFRISKAGDNKVIEVNSRVFVDPSGELNATTIIRDITEQKRSQELRNEMFSNFEKIAEHVPGFIFHYKLLPNGTSHFPYASKGIKEIYGVSANEVKYDASKVFSVIHGDDVQRVINSIRESAETLQQWREDYRVVHPNGQVKWIEGFSSPQKLGDGSILWSGYITDITEKKQGELRLRESEESFRLLYNHAPAMMQSIDQHGNILRVNAYWLRKMGYPEKEVLGRPFYDFLAPRSRHELLRHFKTKTFEPLANSDCQLITKSGNTIDTLISTSNPVRRDENMEKIFAVLIDVTERNQLQKEVEKLASIARYTSNAVIITDINGRITWVNEGFERITEYRFEEVAGQIPGRFLQGPDTDKRVVEEMGTALRKREGFKVEVLNYSKSGRTYWLEIEVMPLKDQQGEVIGFMAIQTDITNLKIAIEKMQTSESILQTFMDHAPLVAFVKDPAGRYTFFNKLYKDFLSEKHLINGLTDFDIFPRDFALECQERDREVISTGKVLSFEHEVGDRTFFEYKFPLRDKAGKVFSLGGLSLDITEKLEAQRQIRENEERLQSISEHLSDGVLFQYVADPQGQIERFRYMSSQAIDLFELSAEEIMSDAQKAFSLVHYDDLAELMAKAEISRKELSPLDHEYRIITPRGKLKWVQTRSTPRVLQDGRTLWDGLSINITERKKLQISVLANEAKLQSIFKTIVSGVLVTNTKGEITYANQSAIETLHLFVANGRYHSRIQWRYTDGKGDFLDRNDLPLFLALQQMKPITNFELGLMTDQYPLKWLSENAAPFFDEEGQIIGAVLSFVDITEQKKNQQTLQQVYDELNAILNASSDASFFLDENYGIRIYNKVAEESVRSIFGKQVRVGDSILMYAASDSIEDFKRNFKTALGGELVYVERQINFSETKKVWSQVRYLPVYNKENNVIGVSFNATDITQRKLMEQQLFQSQKYFESLVNSQSNFLIRTDLNCRFTFVNRQFCEKFTLSADAIVGQDAMPVLTEDVDTFKKIFSQCIKKPGVVVPVTLRYRNERSKSMTYTDWEFVALQDERGKVNEIQAVGLDATQRISHEQELQKISARFKLAAQAASLGVWEWILESGELVWDDILYGMLGFSQDEPISFDKVATHMNAEDLASIYLELDLLTPEQNGLSSVFRIIRPSDGKLRYIRFFCLAEFGDDRKIKKLIGVDYDITEQEIFNKRLLESEERFRYLADNAPVFIWLSDEKNQITFFSKGWYDFTGKTPQSEIGSGWLNGIHSDDVEIVREHFATAFENCSVIKSEFRLRRHDGDFRWMLNTGTPRFLENGDFIGFSGSCVDITERKEAEAALAEKTAFQEAILATIDVGIIACDATGELTLFNRATEEIYGLVNQDTSASRLAKFSNLYHTDGVTPLTIDEFPIFKTLRNGAVKDAELIVQPKNENPRQIVSNGRQLKDKDGRVVGAVIAMHDVTFRNKTVAQLERTLREKELLIKEIHHRVKNNLQLISSILYIKMLSLKNDEIKEFLKDTRQKIKSISLIHERLLQTSEVNEINVSDYLGKLINDLEMTNIRQDLKIQFETSIVSQKITLDLAIYCGLIINELVTNSIKHAFNGRHEGSIHICLSEENKQFTLAVGDNGNSMPAEVRPGSNNSFGMQLLEIFIEQIHGTYTINRSEGTEFVIKFKVLS